jgi:Bacterial alpha-L-rhamnosidase 6 hairpin glycosidase domain
MSGSTGDGLGRRAFIRSGLGTAALAAAGPIFVAARPAAAAAQAPRPGASLAAGMRAPDWRGYVNAPASRQVRPVRVLQVTGDVARPDALLSPGGPVTVLTRPAPVAPPAWPAGTVASYHAPNNGDNGQLTTYVPANAIDGDPDTFWNDDTIGAYPDTLTITAPSAVTLPGITILSDTDGVPVDVTVQTWDGSAWQAAATVTGNSAVQILVPFAAPVSTTQVLITVTLDQATPQGEFTRINEVWPGLVDPVVIPSLVVDFGQDVVGYTKIRFAWASDNNPGVRLAFSETTEYLTDRSDFARSDLAGGGPGTDQYAVPAGGADWTDTDGYETGSQVQAEGLHGFRYVRISLDALPADAPAAEPYGQIGIDAVSLDFTGYLGTPDTFQGWFICSDDALNRYWYGAAYTNELITDTFLATDCDPRDAASPTLEGKLVLQDGAKRDRDPYVGDIAVSGRTLYLTHPDAARAARDVLADLADHQRSDGWIPPASINGYTLPLFDYPLWWVTASWDYVLYTGDPDYAARYYPSLLSVLNGWYPSVTDSNGLLSKGLNGTSGYGDYAFLPRSGEVTYYNANYVQALGDAARIAQLLGQDADAARWTQRAGAVAAAINTYLWDASAGAYLDSATGAAGHPQDGNAIAITSGVAGRGRATAALAYLEANTKLPYGNAFMDNDALFAGASQRVYAFISYPELVARFQTGQADSAIDEIKRMYGWMYANDPGITTREGVAVRRGGTRQRSQRERLRRARQHRRRRTCHHGPPGPRVAEHGTGLTGQARVGAVPGNAVAGLRRSPRTMSATNSSRGGMSSSPIRIALNA